MSDNQVQKQKLRTAKQSVSFAITEVLEVGKILKKLMEVLDNHISTNIIKIKNQQAQDNKVDVDLSGYEIGRINGALRDYLTLRIANIVDDHSAASSLKKINGVDLNCIRKIPQIKQILDARYNWIGHINSRFIGPIDGKLLYSKEITDLLELIQVLICIGGIKEI